MLPRGLPLTTEKTKEDLLATLLCEEYGQIPSFPYEIVAEELSRDIKFAAGKADLVKLTLTCKADFGVFAFPLYYVCPKVGHPVKSFVHINFRDLIPDRYQPTEELVDKGYATLTFCYKDITSDDGDFGNGLAGVLYPNGEQTEKGCGKIGMWAWAACAVLRYALTLPELDSHCISVCGHSRLGKTALLAGALDERFFCAFSNDSGCGGAAMERGKTGERIADITRVFPFWFNKKYREYAGREDDMPFDQHFLVAANYPHRVYVASAREDARACPENEYRSCKAAEEFYIGKGLTGFAAPDRLPEVGDRFIGGHIGYHLRAGRHYFSREDWLLYIEYIERHCK